MLVQIQLKNFLWNFMCVAQELKSNIWAFHTFLKANIWCTMQNVFYRQTEKRDDGMRYSFRILHNLLAIVLYVVQFISFQNVATATTKKSRNTKQKKLIALKLFKSDQKMMCKHRRRERARERKRCRDLVK